MFKIDCAEKLAAAIQHALTLPEESGLTLWSNLRRLADMATGSDITVSLHNDFAPYSMGFTATLRGEPWLCGGLIYHGPVNGSAPNFSVSTNPDGPHPRWELHT